MYVISIILFAARRHERHWRWTGSRKARQLLNRRSTVVPA